MRWCARSLWTRMAGPAVFIDKKTRQEVQVHGKVIVLAASACETARLLLNSRSRQFPKGLANSSVMVGSNGWTR